MPLEVCAIGNRADDERRSGEGFSDFLRGLKEAIRAAVFGYRERRDACLLPFIRVGQLDRGEMRERYRMVELAIQFQVKPNGGIKTTRAFLMGVDAQSEHAKAVGANGVIRVTTEAEAEQPLGLLGVTAVPVKKGLLIEQPRRRPYLAQRCQGLFCFI